MTDRMAFAEVKYLDDVAEFQAGHNRFGFPGKYVSQIKRIRVSPTIFPGQETTDELPAAVLRECLLLPRL